MRWPPPQKKRECLVALLVLIVVAVCLIEEEKDIVYVICVSIAADEIVWKATRSGEDDALHRNNALFCFMSQ